MRSAAVIENLYWLVGLRCDRAARVIVGQRVWGDVLHGLYKSFLFGILITLVNVIGGFAIGVFQMDLSLAESLPCHSQQSLLPCPDVLEIHMIGRK